MTNDDIQFGDVEEEKPRARRRPDEDPHFGVLPCGELREEDLRIYADLDCMLDMEDHALSNPDVELGGVMLGGQYTDSEGRSFVVVTDSVRAEHYESTRGSFKFTHDTWSQITRRLEEYPEGTRMVGWYHTHPDWGVFLSGMDLFICDNFFNKPLDLALVIDPCRQDRGWFQWTGKRGQPPQRTGGFYLYSSRFRESELEYYAQTLEGNSNMPAPIRSGGSSGGGFGAPVVNVMADRSPWPMVAILGMLTLQSVLVGLLVWQSLRGAQDEAIVALLKQQKAETELKARRDTLDDLAHQLTGTKEGFINSLEQREKEVKNLKSQLDTVTEHDTDAKKQLVKYEEKVTALTKERDEAKKTIKEFQDKLAAEEKKARDAAKQAREKEKEAGDETGKTIFGVSLISALGIGLTVAVLLIAAFWFQQGRSQPQGYVEERPRDEPIDVPIATEVSKETSPPANS